jgi:hypothetical protein
VTPERKNELAEEVLALLEVSIEGLPDGHEDIKLAYGETVVLPGNILVRFQKKSS